MTARTPGPWQLFKEDEGFPGIEAEGFSVVVFGHILTDDECGVQGRTREEALANATAIAAVPDLLDALRPFAECCDQISDEESSEEWAKFRLLVSHYRAARDAVRKAERTNDGQ